MQKIKVKTTPFAHQIDAYKKVYGLPFFALLMEQGTGKTKTYIDIASNLWWEDKIDAVLLIAPKGVEEQWADEQIPEHSPVRTDIRVWSRCQTKKRKQELAYFLDPSLGMTTFSSSNLNWFCVNVEAFSTSRNLATFISFIKNQKTAICIDECTSIKSVSAQRTINIMYGLKNIIKKGEKVLSVEEIAVSRAILTGTPVTNSPYDLWSMFEFLKYKFLGNFYGFRMQYGIERKDTIYRGGSHRNFSRRFNMQDFRKVREMADKMTIEHIAMALSSSETMIRYILAHPDLTVPYKNLEKLKQKIAPVTYIVTKEEALDLPPKMYKKLYVELSKEQKRIYGELKREYVSEYAGKELTVANHLALLMRFQQITGGFFPYEEEGGVQGQRIGEKNPKIEVLKRDLQEYDWHHPVIIWARFRAEILLLQIELKKAYPSKKIAVYYGDVEEAKRTEIITEFKQGNIDILISNNIASSGFNLQICNLQYFFSNSFSLEDRVQQEDRSHRLGQDRKVLYVDIVAKNTIDERILAVLKDKKDLLEYFRTKTMTEFMGGKRNA